MPDFKTFVELMLRDPKIMVAALPIFALIVVNGLTDAPVNIATAVNSGAVGLRSASIMAAVCNFSGALCAVATGSTVAVSIYSLSGLEGPSRFVLPALTASTASVTLWALAMWYFGYPTSEGHALSAALTGAAVCVGGVSAVNVTEWLKLGLGILLSTALVAAVSRVTAVIFCKNLRLGDTTYKKLQVTGAAMSAFAHGAQDGQKFAGALALSVSCRSVNPSQPVVPLWCLGISAILISVGVLCGGKRILNTYGSFAPSKSDCGFAADMVSAVSLCLMSSVGIPAATTIAKSSAVFGAGTVNSALKKPPEAVVKMLAVWGLTFPACAALSYCCTKLLLVTEFF